MQLTNNKILITGGATGIGAGLAARFLEEGNTVIICGRRKEALEAAAGKHPGLITYVCDLEQEGDRTALYEWVRTEHPDLSVLVNNAGVQNWTAPDAADFYQKAKQEVAINVLAPIHLTSLFLQLPALATIANVTSGLAFVPLAKVPVYSATKAFFRSYTLSLRHLLKPRNVEVIEIIPPALNTGLGGTGIHAGYPEVSDFVTAVFAQLAEGKTEATFGTSEARTQANNATITEYFTMLNP